jgi:hypothetical protein
MRIFALLLLSAAALFPQQELRPLDDSAQPSAATLRAWRFSAAAVVAAAVVDTHSSWNKCCEANSLLASSDGRFGRRATVIKSSAVAAQMVVQYFAVRHSRRLAKVFTYVNFGTAAGLSAVAVRNYGIPQPPPAGLR